MSIKFFIYAATLLISTFAVTGINFDHFIKTNHIWEARILVVLLIMGLSYLSTNFINDIILEIGI